MHKILSDLEIAQNNEIQMIDVIAQKIGLTQELEYYGNYKAKINISNLKDKEAKGKLILVTAMSPTPAGEGKTTMTIGLGDALNAIGKKTIIALREPSLGPVFGVKGGAAGGGYAQVVPMEDINLHFTGDFHAISAANNLLAALIDNHIYQGNTLNIDARRIIWKRVVDMNDRQLRYLVDGLGGKTNGVPREDSYDITVASEIMAILCLSKDIEDLKNRIGNILFGYSNDNKALFVKDLGVQGAMAALLKDAIKPNLVQTLENNPCLIHGGPFANIAHGCNSIIATQTALKLGDYVVTEAGFGADLGAEKFLDIKCRQLKKYPDAVVIVATIRALKMHGGLKKSELEQESVEAVKKGLPNLLKHIENITKNFGLNAVVVLNHFVLDTNAEIGVVKKACEEVGVDLVISKAHEMGSEGSIDLAYKVVELCAKEKHDFKHAYELNQSIESKIESLVQKIYGGKGIELSPLAKTNLKRLEELGYGNLPICMAKTQYSFSSDPKLLGRPKDFIVNIRDMKVSAGAGFIVVLTGDIMTMPGLPKDPAANHIDIDNEGKITGLF